MKSNICKTRLVGISRFQADVLSLGLDFTRTQWNFPSRILHWQNPPVKCRCSTNTSTTRPITSSEFTVKILNDSYHNVTISAQSNTKCPEYAPLFFSHSLFVSLDTFPCANEFFHGSISDSMAAKIEPASLIFGMKSDGGQYLMGRDRLAFSLLPIFLRVQIKRETSEPWKYHREQAWIRGNISPRAKLHLFRRFFATSHKRHTIRREKLSRFWGWRQG